MTNDLVPHTDSTPSRQVAFLPSKEETGRIWGIAQTLAQTSFVPKALRGDVPAIMAAMLTGRELGILPMRALRQVSIIEGKPTPSPELMMAIALKAGHDVFVAETSRERCVVEIRRADWPDDRVARLTWDLEDAVAAGLCTLDEDTGRPRARSQSGSRLPWEAYTRAMLRSRAVSEACRTWLPDVVEGASYAPEELGARVTEHAHDQELVDAAEERGETFDPLEGETDEVRRAVADAMGEEDVQVDPDTGEEIVDAELVEDDPETTEEAPSEEDDEPADPVRDDAPSAPARAESDDLPEPSDEDPAAAEDGRAIDEPVDPAAEALEEMVDEVVAVEESVDLSEIPDDDEEAAYGAYGAWLAAAAAAYAGLNVPEVSHLIRKGHVDLDGGSRLVIPAGVPGLELVHRFETHAPGPYRRTVRATLDTAGLPKAASVPGPAPHDAEETPEDDPGTDTPGDPSGPEDGSKSLEGRRAALRRWKAAYRELSSLEDGVSQEAARKVLASRMTAGAGEDRAWATVDLEVLEDLVAEVETERAKNLPF